MRTTMTYFAVTVVIATAGYQQQSQQAWGEPPETQSPSGTESSQPMEGCPCQNETTEAETPKGPGSHGSHGFGRGLGGMGPGAMGEMREDMTTLHAMFAARDMIKRTVKLIPNGAETVTESDDETIAGLIQEHVPAMEGRVKKNEPLPPMTFHPLFVELIKHSSDYTFTIQETEKGVKVTYHSEDPFVIMLVQEHAKLVSRFVKNGMSEIHQPYELPKLVKQDVKPETVIPKSSN